MPAKPTLRSRWASSALFITGPYAGIRPTKLTPSPSELSEGHVSGNSVKVQHLNDRLNYVDEWIEQLDSSTVDASAGALGVTQLEIPTVDADVERFGYRESCAQTTVASSGSGAIIVAPGLPSFNGAFVVEIQAVVAAGGSSFAVLRAVRGGGVNAGVLTLINSASFGVEDTHDTTSGNLSLAVVINPPNIEVQLTNATAGSVELVVSWRVTRGV